MKSIPFIFLVFIPILTSLKTAENSQLTVVIDGIKEPNGEIILAIFDNESDFLEKEYTSKTIKVNKNGKATAIFDNLPKGSYSLSVIHDKNQNGKLDKNFIGLPTEGFGFSNNKMGKFGPPSFKDCEIELTQDRQEIVIKLKHI